MLATTATPALLRRLHHLLVFTPPVLEPDFHLRLRESEAGRELRSFR